MRHGCKIATLPTMWIYLNVGMSACVRWMMPNALALALANCILILFSECGNVRKRSAESDFWLLVIFPSLVYVYPLLCVGSCQLAPSAKNMQTKWGRIELVGFTRYFRFSGGVAATLCAIYRCVRHTRKSCMPCCTNINNILVKSTNCIRERETADSAPKKAFRYRCENENKQLHIQTLETKSKNRLALCVSNHRTIAFEGHTLDASEIKNK